MQRLCAGRHIVGLSVGCYWPAKALPALRFLLLLRAQFVLHGSASAGMWQPSAAGAMCDMQEVDSLTVPSCIVMYPLPADPADPDIEHSAIMLVKEHDAPVPTTLPLCAAVSATDNMSYTLVKPGRNIMSAHTCWASTMPQQALTKPVFFSGIVHDQSNSHTCVMHTNKDKHLATLI